MNTKSFLLRTLQSYSTSESMNVRVRRNLATDKEFKPRKINTLLAKRM